MEKIKILYTIPNFDTAGSQKPLFEIAKLLDKNKFIVEIVCLHNRGDFFQKVLQSGIKVHIIDLYKNARPVIKMLKECYQLSKIFKKINPHIIHSYNYAADYTEPLAAKMAGIKWIYTKKNMSWQGPSYRGWKLRSWLADGIICQNLDMLKEFFPRWEKAKLISIGVDINEYKKQPINNKLKKKWGIPEESRIIISVSNLIPVKGIEKLIQAFELLASDFNDWILMIVGDDTTEYGAGLKENLLKKQKLKDKVIFTGKQRNVRELLDISEIYVQPTLNQGRMEGAPIAIQEAMANGKVVLGSNIPGIRDQLVDFPQFLFNPGEVLDLKNKLVQYISNNIKQNIKIGEKFIDYAVSNYDLSIEKENLQQYYLNLIKTTHL